MIFKYLLILILIVSGCGKDHDGESSASSDGGGGSGGTIKKIFYYEEGLSGSLYDEADDLELEPQSGVNAADVLCANSNHAENGKAYKALLSDGDERIACITPYCSGGPSEHTNWALKPNTTYIRASDGKVIFTTNENAIFDFRSSSLTNGFAGDAGGYYFWSGLSSNWTSSVNNCSKFKDSSGSSTVGGGGALDHNAIKDSVGSCNYSGGQSILCVEQ